MKKYQYLASWDDQTLTRVGEPVVVLGDSNVSQVEVILPSNFLLDPTGAVARMYFLLPGEKESGFETLETATKDDNGDSHVTWTIKHVHSQKGGRLAFSLTLIGDDAQWDSRTAIIPVYESRYQPESEEEEEPYTGRLAALEGSMAAIRGEFAEVQDDFEELKETATLGTPIPESLVANMQEGRVYIYTGTETGYTAGHVYYYVNGALTDGGVYGGTAVDTTLTEPGKAADAAAVGAEVSAIKEDLYDNNSYNIFDAYGKYFGGTAQGATLTWDTAHVGTITRAEEATSATVYGAILGSNTEIPTPIVRGESYILLSNITNDNVKLQIMEYRGSASREIYVFGERRYTVPDDITGLMFRIVVYRTFSGTATIRVKMLNTLTNKMLVDEIDRKATVATDINVTASNQEQYPNVDNFPNRSIINIISSATSVLNKPFNGCTIITTGFSTAATVPYGGSKQIAVSSNSGEIAARTHNGMGWSEWTYTDHVFTADNTNFIEVIEKAVSVTNATVILTSGTYNLFDSTHNEAYWKNKRPAARYCGINLKNGVKIIGDGIVNFDANYTGSDEDIKENFSVFNVAGSCEIKNVNINASNICYLVHDDPRIVSNQNNRCVIHGCKLIHNGTDHTFTSGAPMCIGAGESDNSYREYTDNVLDSTYDRSLNVHTATGGKGRYIITNNYFVKGTLGFTAFGDGTGRIEGIVSNNSLPSDIVNRSDGASNPYTFNNIVRS